MDHFSRASYSYDLPPELIAQEAVHPHHDARLMVIDRDRGEITDESTFWHLDRYIPEDRVLFFNDSRVLPARLRLENVHIMDASGEEKILREWEILFTQKLGNDRFDALVKPGKKFKIGTTIMIGEGSLRVEDISRDGRILSAHGISIEKLMERYGELPLPPYITYDRSKERDYQTVFAKHDGSVAAPTASLHFTRELLEKLEHPKEYVTLHVGLGTFHGVDTDDIRDYAIHRELIEIDRDLFSRIAEMKAQGKSILAVGTTVCRTLESLPHLWHTLDDAFRLSYNVNTRSYWNRLEYDPSVVSNITLRDATIFFETEIFLYPSRLFQIVDELITNFHLPESSLLMLVSAFIGRDETLSVYWEAITKGYRFFSFGDGMYIRKEKK